MTKKLLLLIIFILAVFVQKHFLNMRYPQFIANPDCPWCDENMIKEDIVYIPADSSYYGFFSLANPDFVSDILWLRTAYYFGEHALTDKKYSYLFSLLDLITDLSPKWVDPYLFSAVILPVEVGDVDGGLFLIKKGLANHPNNWQLWFFKGYYMWKFKNEMFSASQDISKSATQPGAPMYLATLSASLATKAGQKEFARQFIEEVLQNADDPLQKRVLMDKLEGMSSSE